MGHILGPDLWGGQLEAEVTRYKAVTRCSWPGGPPGEAKGPPSVLLVGSLPLRDGSPSHSPARAAHPVLFPDLADRTPHASPARLGSPSYLGRPLGLGLGRPLGTHLVAASTLGADPGVFLELPSISPSRLEPGFLSLILRLRWG